MLDQLIVILETIVMTAGVPGLFLAAIVEEVIAPIPSALVMLLGGFVFMQQLAITLFSIGKLLVYVALPISLGVTLGSLFIYWIVRIFGKPIILKWGKWFGLSWSQIEAAEKKFLTTTTDEWLLFSLRAIPIIPSVAINAFCGLVRIPLRTYVIFTFLGTVVRALLLSFIGWQVGYLYTNIASSIDAVQDIVLYIFIGVIVVFLGYRLWKNRQKNF